MDGSDIRAWRATNRVKQEALASILGVSRVAVSKWENGQARPSRTMALRLADVMRGLHRGRIRQEVALLDPQGQIKILTRGPLIELVGMSSGFRRLWPEMTDLLNVQLREHLLNEAAAYCGDTDFLKDAQSGDLLMVSGVSNRMIALGSDVTADHRLRWHVITRHLDHELVHEIIYEPCPAATPTGFDRILRLSDIQSSHD